MTFNTWVECHIMCLFAHQIDNKGKVNIGAPVCACSICMHISKMDFCGLDLNLMLVSSLKHKFNLHSYFGDGFLCLRCVGISILGGGSIEAFSLDDEQSKGKVNGSNGSTKTLERT